MSYYGTSQLSLVWSTTGSGGGLAVNARGSGRFSDSGNINMGNGDTVAYVTTSKATLIVGFALQFVVGATNVPILALKDGGTSQIDLRLAAGGAIQLVRTGTPAVLATSTTGLFTSGIWYYLELKATINNSTGAYELRLNGSGTPLFSASGVNTRSSSNNSADTVYFSGGGSTQILIGDVVILDTTSSGTPPNNDFLGDVRVQCQLPTGDGAHTDWTPSTGVNHWANVDEVTPNGDTDYNSTNTLNNIDTYTLSPVTPLTGSVFARKVNMYARKDDAGARSIAAEIRHSSTDATGSNKALSTSYVYQSQIFETNPANSSAAWTISDCNNDQVGVKVTV
jgi:hypothetical protein